MSASREAPILPLLRYLRRILQAAAGGVLLYLLLAVIVEAVLYANKAAIEKSAAVFLGAESVKAGRILNLPLFSIQLEKIQFKAHRSTKGEVEKLRLDYDLAGLLFRGMPGFIKKVSLDGLSIQSTLPEVSLIAGSLAKNAVQTNGKPSAPLHFGLEARRVHARLTILATARVDLSASLLTAQVGNNQFNLAGEFNLDSRLTNIVTNGMGNDVGYLHSAFHVNLNLTNLAAASGRCRIFFDNLSFAGIPLIEKEALFLGIDRHVRPEIRNTGMTNWISLTNGQVKVDFSRVFPVRYSRYHEFHLIDTLLPPADYRADLKVLVTSNDWNAKASVLPVSNLPGVKIQLSAWRAEAGFALTGSIASPKWGKASAAFTLPFQTLLPSGNLRMENVPFLNGGLRITADTSLESASNVLFVRARDVRINGGYIGYAENTITLMSNGVKFESPKKKANAFISGILSDTGYQIGIDISDVPGTAVVSNIRLDALSISKGRYSGGMRIFNNAKNELEITGKLDGYREVLAQNAFEIKKGLSAELRFNNMRLSFPKLEFPLNGLAFHGYLDFIMTNYGTTWIQIGGDIAVFEKNVVPLTGRIGVLSEEGKTIASFIGDGAVSAFVTVLKDRISVSASADQYRLERIGLTGVLNADISMELTRMRLSSLDATAKYTVSGRDVLLRVKTRKQEGSVLLLDKFAIDAGSDILYGSGSLRTVGDRLTGSVSFLRGGGIEFSASFSDLVAQVDIRNFMIRDFLFKDQRAYVSAKFNFYGPLVFPNYTGSFRAMNPVDSPWLSVDIPYIVRRWDSLGMRGANIEYRSHKLQGDVTIGFKKPGLTIRAQGDAVLAGFVKGAFQFDYGSFPATRYLDYTLSALSLHGEAVEDVAGKATWEKGRWTIAKIGNYGVSGFMEEDVDRRDWSIDYFWTGLKGSFDGNTEGGNLDANLNLTTRLSMIQFPQVFRKVDGDLRLDVRIRGPLSSPSMTGGIRINNGNMVIDYVNTQIRKVSLNVPIVNSKIILRDAVVPTTTGDFKANGYVDIKDLSISYMDVNIAPATNRPAMLSLNIDNPNFKIIGNAGVRSANVTGTLTALNLIADVLAEDAFVLVDIDLGPKKKREPSLLEAIFWNVTLTAGNGVKFTNPYIDTIAERGTVLQVLGSMGNRTLTLKGEAAVKRGTLSFLGRDFIIRDGTARFSGMPGDLIPYVNLNATYQYRDTETVNVYLTFDGRVNKLTLRDPYSVPDRPKNELYALLAGGTSTSTNTTLEQLGTTAVNTMENYLVFNPLSLQMRRTLGLDLVSIRSKMIGNAMKNVAAGMPINGPEQIFEGSSVVLGKYLLQDLFLQTEFTFSTNQSGGFSIQPTFGLQYDLFRFMNIEVKYNPFQPAGINPTNFDVNLQIQRRF